MSDNPSVESGALDTNQAAAAFTSILGGEEPPKEQDQPQAEASADDPEAAAVELAAQEPAEEPKLFTVKVDGKEMQVPLDELVNGYQRQSDYTQKTMAAADARKAAEAEATKAREERQQYASKLQVMAAQLQGALQNPPDPALIASDPIEYMKQQAQHERWQAQMQQVQTEWQQLTQAQQAEEQKARSEYLQQQHQALLDKLPEWKDEAKAKADKAALVQALKDQGFSEQELSQLADHRIVLMAREAMKYRELMAKAKEAAKKVAPLPKVERPGNPEVSKPDGRTAAMQRLGKTGRVEDAASVFASFL